MTTIDTLPITPPLTLEAQALITMEGRELALGLKSEFDASLALYEGKTEEFEFSAPFNPLSPVDVSARNEFLSALNARNHPKDPNAYLVKGGRVILFSVDGKIPGAEPDDPFLDVTFLTTARPSVEA